MRLRYGEQAADGCPDPPVPRSGWQAAQFEWDRDGNVENVAVRRDNGGGEVPDVDVDSHDRGLPQFV
jgi:hypothetical protein